MEALQEALQDGDPRRIGPYAILARLRATASAVQYVGRDEPAGGKPVVLSLARAELAALPAFRSRFAAEARTAERLAGGWVLAPVDLATGGDELWTAYPYVPAVTLGEAIALAGPLPERAVRTLGAGLAETLSRVHATGAVLHGLAPETVLLAADGPRLSAFGALGAAAHAEPAPGGGLSVRLGYLTPEQLAGAQPGTASDLFVLGLLLAYAATGTTPFPDGRAIAGAVPELDGVPGGLRDVVESCLAKSPADRPTAGSAAATLALEGAAALAKDGWLPESVAAALAGQADAVARLGRDGGPDVSRPGTASVASVASAVPALPPGTASGAGTPPRAPGGSERPRAAGAGEVSDGVPAAAPEDAPGTALPVPAAGAGLALHDTAASPAPASTPSGGGATAGTTGSGVPPQDAPGAGPSEDRGRDTLALSPAEVRRVDSATAALGVPRVRSAPEEAASDWTAAAVPGALPDRKSEPVPAAHAALPAHGPGPVPPVPGAHDGWAGQPTGTAGTAPDGGDAPKSALTASVLAAKAGAERRALLLGGVAGAVGLLVGGGVGVALAGGDEKIPAAAPGPAPAAKPLPGVPPAPLWAYRHQGGGSPQVTAWRDRVLVVSDEKGCTGVDLRSGRRLWTQSAAAGAGHRPVVAGDGLLVIGAAHFLWLSPQDGTVRHRIAAPVHVSAVTAAEGPVVWLTGTSGPGTFLVAYDAVARRELWRAQVPNGRGRNAVPRYQGVAVRPDGVLVRQDGGSLTPQQQKANRGRGLFALYDTAGGKRLWGRYFGSVHQSAPVFGDPAGRLYAAAGSDLHAFDTRSGRQLWRAAGAAGEGSVHGGTLFVPTDGHRLYALDAASGATRWTQSTEAGGGGGRPRVLLSAGGRTALVLESTQVTAFAAADGTRLWKFQDAGGRDPVGGYRGVVAGHTAVVWRDRAFYALPVGR
ncbi:outer membrane protein assembly factor BamB family protein [Streptomyces wuyuanensis]|uniref:outer membrane protein assembly factor BamB family protein n=1 Tax=Streptomyces wuyuanensis TaxID=1196353 RepID=UPI0037F27400